MELEDQLKGWKRQLKDLTNLDEILAAEAEAEKAEIARAEKLSDKVRKPKKLFRYDTIEAPLEVKLSDELTNNLKNLKPEGNLFYDLMMNLQSTGKIETRVPVGKKRKYAPKVTEKWTYKDFK
jgi:nucleolar protein 53